ncbi:unnamed protein product [Lactuca saligna]|uniref:Transposase, mutator type n=1 Tax=Lactuca saligna TaxID=75948 RepID=A0AA35UUX1_LACSI|nr:unnamed protein product [Lactuca saligna]
MICEIGYSADDTMYYHYRIPNLDLDFGLKALGNDQDVISMTQFVPQNRVINVYVEHGSTRLHTYFMSPIKVVIEQLDDDPSPELNRIRPKKKGIVSCSKKLDMNVPLKESANQAQREDGVYDFSMSLVPFEPNKQDMVNEFKDDSYFPVPEETDTMQEITVDINCQNHREMLDDFEPFSSDGYQNIGEFEREVEAEEEQDEEDEQGCAEDSKDDLEEHTEEDDDSDYIVDPEAILDDWEVDMREFHSCVDEIEWFGQGPNIELDLNQDDDLGVINNDEFESAGYEEDLRKRMLKNLNKNVPCSSGVVHVTPFFVGRPKKKRRRAIDEPTNQSKNLSRKFLTVTCSKCHNKGHNSRTCKGKGGSSQRAVGGSSLGGVGGSSKDAVGGKSQGSVGGSSENVMGGLRAKKIDKGKKASSRT